MPCNMVEVYQHFGGTSYLHQLASVRLHSLTYKKTAIVIVTGVRPSDLTRWFRFNLYMKMFIASWSLFICNMTLNRSEQVLKFCWYFLFQIAALMEIANIGLVRPWLVVMSWKGWVLQIWQLSRRHLNLQKVACKEAHLHELMEYSLVSVAEGHMFARTPFNVICSGNVARNPLFNVHTVRNVASAKHTSFVTFGGSIVTW